MGLGARNMVAMVGGGLFVAAWSLSLYSFVEASHLSCSDVLSGVTCIIVPKGNETYAVPDLRHTACNDTSDARFYWVIPIIIATVSFLVLGTAQFEKSIFHVFMDDATYTSYKSKIILVLAVGLWFLSLVVSWYIGITDEVSVATAMSFTLQPMLMGFATIAVVVANSFTAPDHGSGAVL